MNKNTKTHQIIRKCFYDEKGNITLFQSPNLPIVTYFVSLILQKVFWNNSVLLDSIAFGSLFTWAWLEIFYGTNYFRRVLGITVISYAILSKL